jgi:hypothetical protein
VSGSGETASRCLRARNDVGVWAKRNSLRSNRCGSVTS